MVKDLEGLTEEDVIELSLPKGIPIIYELDKNLNPIKPSARAMRKLQKTVEAVAAQEKVRK